MVVYPIHRFPRRFVTLESSSSTTSERLVDHMMLPVKVSHDMIESVYLRSSSLFLKTIKVPFCSDFSPFRFQVASEGGRWIVALLRRRLARV